jgi:hypothetical protein
MGVRPLSARAAVLPAVVTARSIGVWELATACREAANVHSGVPINQSEPPVDQLGPENRRSGAVDRWVATANGVSGNARRRLAARDWGFGAAFGPCAGARRRSTHAYR